MEAANSGAPVRINAVRVVLRESGEGRMEVMKSVEGGTGAGRGKNPLASWIWNTGEDVNFYLRGSRKVIVRVGNGLMPHLRRIPAGRLRENLDKIQRNRQTVGLVGPYLILL